MSVAASTASVKESSPAKQLVPAALLLLIIGGVAIAAPHTPFSGLLAPAPCSEPIAYHIDTVDGRFGLSQEDFGIAVHEAAALWNEAAGKELLAESEQGELPVRLAFDDRQRATVLAGRIDTAQAETEEARAQIEERQQSLAARSSSLERAITAFNRRADAYQTEVSEWNEKGGAPPEEHDRLEVERKALQQEQARLSDEARAVDAYSLEIGRQVEELNERIRRINARVDTFNETAEHEFEQGLYIEDEQGKRIVIYEFSSRDELVWVLAHEFGHALGIGHLDDTTAVMFARNLGSAPVLSEADRAALTARCEGN